MSIFKTCLCHRIVGVKYSLYSIYFYFVIFLATTIFKTYNKATSRCWVCTTSCSGCKTWLYT